MGIWRRLLAITPAVVLLSWIGFEAVRHGVVGSAVANASRELERLAGDPVSEAGPWWREDLVRASREAPANPSVRELMSLLALRNNDPADAQGHLMASLQARPGSGYTWANLMAARYRLGDTGPGFEKALVNAMSLAPFEPEVQRTVADFGLAVLDEVTPVTRAAIERAVAARMKRNAPEILQIAARRGRLDVACRHLDGVPRPAASKWTQLCQSMEATP
jgi:predicted Zn-dependent protease